MARYRRWDKHAIRAEVHRKGTTLTRIALDAGLEASACRTALIRRHYAGERALASYLEINPSILWPNRYSPDPELNGASEACHCQIQKAA